MPEESVELRIGHLSTLYHTCFILMEQDMVLDDRKIDVKWSLFSTGPAMIRAFMKGELDAGYTGLPPAAIGIDRGFGMKCIAGGHVEGTVLLGRCEYQAFGNAGFSISDVLAQFKGKIIGVPSNGSIHDILLAQALRDYGLDNDIEVKHYEQAEFIALDLASGMIDAGCGTPALAAFATTIMGSRVLIPPDQFWAYNPSYGVFFTDRVIEDNPSLIIAFLKQHRAASELIRKNPWHASELIASAIKVVDAKYVLSVLRISPRYCISLPQEYIDASMRLVSVLRNLGYIKRDLSTSDLFDTTFIEQIHPEPHHYRIPMVFLNE